MGGPLRGRRAALFFAWNIQRADGTGYGNIRNGVQPFNPAFNQALNHVFGRGI
jgi:hypothetical protein